MAFWKENTTIRAYDDQKIQAMGLWDPNNDMPATRKDQQIELSMPNASLKVTKVEMSMLEKTLQFMKVCHDKNCFTGPLLLLELSGREYIPTPPFCGSVGAQYADCGPRKTNLEPSAKSDLTLLFTCLKETDLRNTLWTTRLKEVSEGKTVDQFLVEIQEAGLD